MRGRVFQTVLQLHDLQAGNTISFVVIIPPSFSIFSKRPRHLHHGGEKFSGSLGHPSLSSSPSLSLSLSRVELPLFRWKVNFNWVDIDRFNEKSCRIREEAANEEKPGVHRMPIGTTHCILSFFSIWLTGSLKNLSPPSLSLLSLPWIFQVWKFILFKIKFCRKNIIQILLRLIAINHS